METKLLKVYRYSRNSSMKEVHGNIGLSEEKIKTSNKQPNLLSKENRKKKKKQENK